jgi:pre-mRNA-splicing factor 18
MYGWIHF